MIQHSLLLSLYSVREDEIWPVCRSVWDIDGQRGGGLQLNGSSIRQWWIQHHYCSMVTTLIIVTLPVDSPAVQTFVFRLLSWSVAQVLPAPRSLGPVCRASIPHLLKSPWCPCSGQKRLRCVSASHVPHEEQVF